MNKQRGVIPVTWIVYGLIAAAAIGGFALLVHRYNESVRKPLVQEIKFLKDSIEANKKQAAEILAAKIAENAQLKAKSDADAKQKDADYAKLLARFNARGPIGVRDLPQCGNSSGSAGQAGKDNPGTPEKPAAESGTGDAPRELVVTEAAVAEVLKWYAYADSCHRFVNEK